MSDVQNIKLYWETLEKTGDGHDVVVLHSEAIEPEEFVLIKSDVRWMDDWFLIQDKELRQLVIKKLEALK